MGGTARDKQRELGRVILDKDMEWQVKVIYAKSVASTCRPRIATTRREVRTAWCVHYNASEKASLLSVDWKCKMARRQRQTVKSKWSQDSLPALRQESSITA
jgi:hypothetical protein